MQTAANNFIMNQEQQEKALAKLRESVEGVVERKMKTPKDFEFLSECIFEKFHERISPTTLKRLWGYLSETTTPRKSTLDILSMFVGYDNWKEFTEFTEGTEDTEKEPVEEKATGETEESEEENSEEEAIEPCHTLRHHRIIADRHHFRRLLSSV